jgi:alcohol dehydrogenase
MAERFTLDADGFDAEPRTRIVFGPGRVERVGVLTKQLGARRVLLVTDPGLVATGHPARVRRLLEAADIEVLVFDQVQPNPSTLDIDACLDVVRGKNIDAFVAVGGGSAIDAAKGCNFLLTNGGRMADYRGHGKVTKPLLPLVVIPTTAGTGSECQSYALISDASTHQKMACGDPSAAPRVAILDPTLTVTQPREVAGTAGIDTVVHAVETAVTRARNAFSLMHAREAFRLANAALPRVMVEPTDLIARGQMQLASAYAGLAIEHSMLGATHSAANPLTAHFDVPHGRAVGLMMPSVAHYNAVDPAAQRAYAELAVSAGLALAGGPIAEAVATLFDRLEVLLTASGTPRSLSAYEVTARDIPKLAAEAATQWTAGFNPRPVDAAAFERLYGSVLE